MIRRDAFVLAAIVAGVALRVWVLASPLGTLDADEAIVGLMARHALEGELSVFYWGALYGGSQEALLAALVFAAAGSSVLALKLVSVAIFAAAAVLAWRVGIRTVGEPAARIGASLFWVWPPFLVWWSTKERGYFGSGLVIGLVAVLFALRLRERDSRADAAVLGLAVGLGLWATVQSWLLAVPAIVWLVWRRPSVLRLAWVALPAAVLGAAPWLAWNLRHGWNAVVPESVAGAESTYLGRFWDFFAAVLPTWLGLRVPYSLDWTFGVVVGVALLLVALAGFAFLLVRRPRALEPLLAIAVAFPFLYAASSFTFLITEPRYLVFIAPVVALLIGHALETRLRLAAVGLAVALAVSIVGLRTLERQDLFTPEVHEGGVTTELGPLIDRLEREGVDHVFANYWLAYRISFESDERVIATSTGHVRYEPHHRAVRSDPNAAYVYFEGAPEERRLEGYRRVREGPFAIYLPRRLRIVVGPPSQTTS